MTVNLIETVDQASAPRRIFLRNAGFAASGLGAIAMVDMSAHAKADPGQDVNIMQGALALEHEGIAAYQLAGASGLLTPGTLKIALVFMGHHQQHRDSLMALISKAGRNPVKPKTDAEYTQVLNLGTLKSEGDVVALATRLERGATNAYAGQIAALQDRKLAHLFGQLATDEAVHWTTLNNALGQPIQAKAYLFG